MPLVVLCALSWPHSTAWRSAAISLATGLLACLAWWTHWSMLVVVPLGGTLIILRWTGQPRPTAPRTVRLATLSLALYLVPFVVVILVFGLQDILSPALNGMVGNPEQSAPGWPKIVEKMDRGGYWGVASIVDLLAGSYRGFLLLGLFGVAILLCVSVALGLKSMRQERLVPVWLFLASAIPLLASYDNGDQIEIGVLWATIAAAAPAGWALRRLPGRWTSPVLLWAVAVLSLAGLAYQWRQTPDSTVFRWLLTRGVAHPAGGRDRGCEGGRCRELVRLTLGFHELVARHTRAHPARWQRRGYCVAHRTWGFPEALLLWAGRCQMAFPSSVFAPVEHTWQAKRVACRLRSGERVCSLEATTLTLPSCPAHRAFELPRDRLCRWMVALVPPAGSGVAGQPPVGHRRLGALLRRWQAKVPCSRLRTMMTVGLADGRTLRVWRLTPAPGCGR